MERKKYRLRKEEGNFIDFGNETIELNIPVTDERLIYQYARGIPNEKWNAILVWIKGSPKPTPDEPVTNGITASLTFSEIGISKSEFQEDPYLLVIIFNNTEEPLQDYVDCLINEVGHARHYLNARDKIRVEKKCKVLGMIPLQPREQDGDVIGGNQ